MQVGAKVIGRRVAFQCKVKVFRIAAMGKQESERRSSMKRKRDHRSGSLQRGQNPSWTVLLSPDCGLAAERQSYVPGQPNNLS